MGDESGSLEGKSLSNLRVVDLKMELEKRGLSKSGSKKELVKRLKQKLELEKLYEESSATGESEPKLQLDKATEQNEFVKEYLATQQKIYAHQKEFKRQLELKIKKEEELGGTDNSDSEVKNQDCDVSEGLSLSKSTCDSSAVVEGDHDDKETPVLQKSESEDAPVALDNPVSSNQENLCDSTNSPNQATHGRVEPSDIPAEMESKSGDTVTFSLLDINLPESPQMSGRSGSKSPRNKSDKLPLKSSPFRADPLVHEQENFKTNGSIPKISRSGRWHEGRKTSSDETDKISDSAELVEQVSGLPASEERSDGKSLCEEGDSSVNDKEVKKKVDSSCKLEAETSLEDLKMDLVEKTSISSDREVENQESKFSVPKTPKSDPDQVMEISESNTSTGDHSVRTDNVEKERDPISTHKKTKQDDDVEMVDVSEIPVQSREMKKHEKLPSTKMLKRWDRSRNSSHSSNSRSSSPERRKSGSPELRERTDLSARHRRDLDTKRNRYAKASRSRSPDSKQKNRGLRQKRYTSASRSRSPDVRQRVGDIRRKRDSRASSIPDARRSLSPGVRHREQDVKQKRGPGLNRSKSPDVRPKERDTRWKRDFGVNQNMSPVAKHSDKDIRRKRELGTSRSRSPDARQKGKDTRWKREPGASWRKSPDIRQSKISDKSRSRSPDAKRSRSPDAKRSRSPGASRSRSPGASKSRSPDASKSRSPDASRTRSPGASKSRSPGASKSRSPGASRTRSPGASKSRSPDASKSRSPDASRSKLPEISQSKSPKVSHSKSRKVSRSSDASRSKSPEIRRSQSPDSKSKGLEMSESKDTKIIESISPVIKQIHRPKRKSISPKRKQSNSPKRRRSTSPFIRKSNSPSFKSNTASEVKESYRPKKSISPERRQKMSLNKRQSISPHKRRSPSLGKGRINSPEERHSSPETRSVRKREVEREKLFLDNSSDSSSDSDHRESKRGTSMRNKISQAKRMPIIEGGESAFEKEDPEHQQPKWPKLNRHSFSISETTIQNASRKNKVSSSDQNITSPEEKPLSMVEDMMVTHEVQPSASAAKPAIPPEKISYRKLNVPFKKQMRQETDKDQNSGRKRRWRSSTNMLQNTGMNISTDSLKNIMPEFKLIPASVPLKEMDEVPPKVMKGSEVAALKGLLEKKVTRPKDEKNKEVAAPPNIEKTKSATPSKIASKQRLDITVMSTPTCSAFSSALDAMKFKKSVKKPVAAIAVAAVKKEEPMKKETEKRKPAVPRVDLPLEAPKPVVKPVSCIVFVQNLVRPFTLNQLKTLLNQTGSVIEDGFWIDKIKSKCFVKYQNEEEATKTKEALHETRWPPSNPKILSVEFATQEEFDLHSKGYDMPKPSVPVAPQPDIRKREVSHEPTDLRKRRAERHSREREHSKQNVTYVREWDKDKLTQESPEREHVRPPKESHRNRSSESKKDSKKDSKKKPVEDTPAKLLDDLFQKTKNTPCIYWLPLTEEQVKIREDERRQRRLDREKRNKLERDQEAERRAKRKPREKENRSRSRSRQGKRR